MNELATKYNPADVEEKWYAYWLKNGLFKSKPDGREPYTVVIPPPNVTGILHMGHMLNNTIQDILVRRARMEGKNACWVPGTDHFEEDQIVGRLDGNVLLECKVQTVFAGSTLKGLDVAVRHFNVGDGGILAHQMLDGLLAAIGFGLLHLLLRLLDLLNELVQRLFQHLG